jgi:hypothetical protein
MVGYRSQDRRRRAFDLLSRWISRVFHAHSRSLLPALAALICCLALFVVSTSLRRGLPPAPTVGEHLARSEGTSPQNHRVGITTSAIGKIEGRPVLHGDAELRRTDAASSRLTIITRGLFRQLLEWHQAVAENLSALQCLGSRPRGRG